MEQRRVVRREPEQKIEEGAPKTEIAALMSETTEQLLHKVNQIITKIEKKLLFDGSREPSLFELNKAIAEWEHVHLNLVLVYEEAAWALDIARSAYEEFLNDKIVETRQTYNNSSVSKTMWMSTSEIEAYTKSKYKAEFAKLKLDVFLAEREKSATLRIITGWETYQFQLSQLSRNSIAEVSAYANNTAKDFNPND